MWVWGKAAGNPDEATQPAEDMQPLRSTVTPVPALQLHNKPQPLMETIQGPRVERIDADLLLGEGSLWCPRLGKWLLVNIHGKAAYLLDTATPGSPALQKFPLPEQVGTIVQRAPNPSKFTGEQALVALKSGLAFLDLTTGAVTPIPGAPAEPPKNRWNDGKCSPEGRFWGGTMEDATFTQGVGSLYVFDEGGIRKALGGVTISNGLAWSLDGKTMYYIDTPRNDVQAFDYDAATGSISNGRVAFATAFPNPDGCTLDSLGRLWVAHWGASRVVCYDLTEGRVGTPVVEVITPTASRVSSCAFGGANLDDLLITTAYEGMTEPDRAGRAAVGEGFAGDLFIVRGVGVKGVVAPEFRG